MYATDAIILKKYPAGEYDALFSVYTKEFGKIRPVAQGIKKETAKLKGHTEFMNLCNISFVFSRGGERLVGASLINFWPGIKADFKKTFAAWHMTELIDRNCFLGQKDLVLWNLIISAFARLEALSAEDTGPDWKKYLPDFEKEFLRYIGYDDGENVKLQNNRSGAASPASIQ